MSIYAPSMRPLIVVWFYYSTVHTNSAVTPQSTIFLVPRQQYPRFVNRPNVYQKLHNTIETSKTETRYNYIALCGLGGMGKTEIVLEYCYQQKQKQKCNYSYIFWIEAD